MVPAHPLRRLTAGIVLLAAAGACGASDGGRSLDAFCDAVDALATDDPFEDLAVASPHEMRTAFDHLAQGVTAIATTAPDEHRARAERYRDAVDELREQLDGAGYDPRALDPLTYRSATDDYRSAAASVASAADASCP